MATNALTFYSEFPLVRHEVPVDPSRSWLLEIHRCNELRNFKSRVISELEGGDNTDFKALAIKLRALSEEAHQMNINML